MSKTTFVVASHNQHKLKEFARILEPLDIEIVTPSQCGGEGIEPVALNGAPGVYSARYSGGNDDDNNEFLLKNLEGVPFEKRTARYVCVICCAYPDGSYFTVRGECEGRIGFEYRGENGFGYDPLFYFDSGKTFAEISGEEKDILSHRGKALRLLAERLSEK